jgi:hypothetical protein
MELKDLRRYRFMIIDESHNLRNPKRRDYGVLRDYITVNDPRWHFKDESLFPKPREFHSKPRKYRAGRGSSVPLDLSSL